MPLNLLLGHNAFQSKTEDDHHANLAVDGFSTTCSIAKYDTSSLRVTGAWWFVDIGRVAHIKRAQLISGALSFFFLKYQ